MLWLQRNHEEIKSNITNTACLTVSPDNLGDKGETNPNVPSNDLIYFFKLPILKLNLGISIDSVVNYTY